MQLLISWALAVSGLTLVFLGIRALLSGRISMRARYALWLILAARLMIPVQMPFTLPVPAPEIVPIAQSISLPEQGRGDPAGPAAPAAPAVSLLPEEAASAGRPAGRTPAGTVSLRRAVPVLWATGALLLLAFTALSNLRFRRRLQADSRPLEVESFPLPVRLSASLASPCLVGFFHPTVWLTPEAADDPAHLRHVLAHEYTHWRHRDHLWAPLRCLCLALHWYNPLVWAASVLSRQDGELACDEGAVALLGEEQRVPYGLTLMDLIPRTACGSELFSCSTAMRSRHSSIRRRIELLLLHPRTVRRSLLAAVLALSIALLAAFSGCSSTGSQEPDMDGIAEQLTQLSGLHETGSDLSTRELTVPFSRTAGERTLIAVLDTGTPQAAGLQNLCLGVWNQKDQAFEGEPILSLGDGARFTAWEEDGTTWLFVTNFSSSTGQETGKAPIFLRFGADGLEQVDTLPDAARSGSVPLPVDGVFFFPDAEYWMDHKAVADGTAFQLYERNPAWDIASGKDQWILLGTVPLTAAAPEGAADTASGSSRSDGSFSGTATSPQAPSAVPLHWQESAQTQTMEEFPDLTFSYRNAVLTATRSGTQAVRVDCVRDLWLTDLNGDGFREICLTRREIPGDWCSFLTVLDLQAGRSWILDGRMGWNSLELAEEDGALVLSSTTGESVTTGPLVLGPSGLTSTLAPDAISTSGSLTPGVWPLFLDFASGSGAWSTDLILQEDGSFTGSYSDANMSTVYVCTFHGRFSAPEPLNATTWSLTLEELTLDTGRAIGEEWTEGEYTYISSGPYGLDDRDGNPLQPGALFRLFSPEADPAFLPEEVLSWCHGESACWGLYSTDTQRTFRTY